MTVEVNFIIRIMDLYGQKSQRFNVKIAGNGFQLGNILKIVN